MPPRQLFTAAVLSILLIVTILELVRRGRLKEEYSWIWIIAGFMTLVTGLWMGFLRKISFLIGSENTGAVFLFLAVFFLVLANLHSATKISSLSEKIRILAQEVAFLKSGGEEESSEGKAFGGAKEKG